MKSPDEMTDAEYIELDAGWPFWPTLPVKHRGSNDVGIIMADRKNRIWHTNIWEPSHGSRAPVDGIEDASSIPHTDYDSVDALVADGWVVD